MSHKNFSPSHHDESYRRAAVDYLQRTGSTIEEAAAELGVAAHDLRSWQKKARKNEEPKNLTGIAQLKAENEALRNEVMQLQVQWDILKTTLGVLTTTVGSSEPA